MMEDRINLLRKRKQFVGTYIEFTCHTGCEENKKKFLFTYIVTLMCSWFLEIYINQLLEEAFQGFYSKQPESYLGVRQTSTIKLFQKIVNG